MKPIKKVIQIALILILTFQTTTLYAAENDRSLGNEPGAHSPPGVAPEGVNRVNPGPVTVFPGPGESLPDVNPLSRFTPNDFLVESGPVIKPFVRPSLPTTIKPLPLPRVQKPEPTLPKFENLAREREYETLRTAKKKKKKNSSVAVEKKASDPKIVRENSNYVVRVDGVELLSLTSQSLAFKAIFQGLNQNMEVNALLRSSKDSDLAEPSQIIGMDCKSNSCTGLAQDLDPEAAYMLALAIKNPDEEVLHELVSNIDQRAFTTPALPAGAILDTVKRIFLQERPEQQTPIDESTLEISDLQSTNCTAVAVCPKRSYNVAAKSQNGNDRIVGTVALFDGKGDRYVSSFRLQKKPSLSTSLSPIL
jgi:hypothetical protein